MVRCLVGKHRSSKSVNREFVEELLGVHDDDVEIGGDVWASYSLGMCSGFHMDYDSLYVCFDSSGYLS